MEAFSCVAPVPSQNYTGCTFNFFSKDNENSPTQPQKKRRAYINESDDEDWTLTLPSFSELLRTSRISWMKLVFPLIRLTEFMTHDVKVFLFCIQNETEKRFRFCFLFTNRLSTAPIKYFNWPSPLLGWFQNGCNKVIIEPRVVQFWSEIILLRARSISVIIIYMKKLLNSDWLREIQFSGNPMQKRVN